MIQIESGMSTEEIQIALQDLYLILSDKGLTDTATAINCAIVHTKSVMKINSLM